MELPLKVRLCRHFENGYCKRGSDCHFAHGLHDLNFKTNASIVYGIERPSSESPKPPVELLSNVISNEEWHVLDSPKAPTELGEGLEGCGRDTGLAGEVPADLGKAMAQLSPDSIARRPPLPDQRKASAKVHPIHESLPCRPSNGNLTGPLHAWVEQDWLHRLPVPDARRNVHSGGSNCLL